MLECKKINELMLAFMENSITEEENSFLQNHLKSCKDCSKDFALYTEILDEFLEKDNLLEAPESLELNVMQKIENIEPKYLQIKNKMQNFCFVSLISYIALLTLTLITRFNKENILLLSNQKSILYKLLIINDHIENFNTSISGFFNEAMFIIQSNLGLFFNSLKLVSFVIIITLLASQLKDNFTRKAF